ncbi:hypothetical protein SH661x_002376 [Planctomicrobium sp. SH661]|uniref:hypothetical protein n=1 Tax=Planctomicrobium sp. SH661 TaxID=3448124 RepID=UPI003F5C2D14
MIKLKTPRERRMALILLCCGPLMLAWRCADRWVGTPLRQKQSTITALNRRLQELSSQQNEILHSQRSMTEVAEAGLARDPMVALLDYQHWLVDSTRKASLQDVLVSLGRPVQEEDVGSRIPFTINCHGTFLSVVQWLQLFNSASALHRIAQLSLSPNGNPDSDQLNISIQLEAISLNNGPEKSLLTATTHAAGVQYSKLKLFASSREPFRRKTNAPEPIARSIREEIAKEPDSEPVEPETERLSLIACGTRETGREAWLHRSGQDEPTRVSKDQRFQVGDQWMTVRAIGSDYIRVQSDHEEIVVQLGEHISATETN